MRPFFEIIAQDGLARRGKLTLGGTFLSGFCTIEAGGSFITAEGYQNTLLQVQGSHDQSAEAVLSVPVVVPLPRIPPPSPEAPENAHLIGITHPFLAGPAIRGRCSSAWGEIQNDFQSFLPSLPLDAKMGLIIPAWEETTFLEEYLAFFSAEQRLCFALIQFDNAVLRDNRRFLRNWNIIQNRLPSNIFYVAWGQISPFFAPILAYLGFDGFAGFGCTTLASKGKIATPYGGVAPDIGQTVSENNGDRRQQNWKTLNGIAREIRGREEYGMLRDFVELSTHFENPIAAMLRNFDAMNEDNPPAGTRSNKSSSLQCTSVEAYSRPELVLYRQRLLQRYATPAYKKVIVILPCAATKPYSNSPSHRKMRNAIQRGARSMRKAVEELIITSPLGVVPRALEEIYPAAFYDVPVTGHWDETEVNISVHMLSAILAQSPSDVPVIALAEGGYLTVCQQVKEQVPQPFTIFTPAPKLLSYDVLTEFSSRIADVLAEYDIASMPNTPPAKNEQYSAIADFQFGIGAGHILFSCPLNVQSPPQGPTRIIDRSTRQIIATVQPSGLLRPRLDGVSRLVMGDLPALDKIYFTGDALSGSSLFAAGIDGVEGDIRPGDFIVILNRITGKILATAEAVVDGNTMLRLRHGPVAKILEKAKGGS